MKKKYTSPILNVNNIKSEDYLASTSISLSKKKLNRLNQKQSDSNVDKKQDPSDKDDAKE
ncbi:hypothetical protein M8998_01850 [Sphingobacterium sp. lm-10]|uniref:hypothetical protein n=1 Tax=Sphingobacterium sp. lm-10 TaxID=2944904 RepID=UPI00201FBBB1|nr:hypothetical protein [Sphingobacterium sp. lm-10]MCL7986675.1 hypothetical protein [Sphingobacterium sp. lm-10]